MVPKRFRSDAQSHKSQMAQTDMACPAIFFSSTTVGVPSSKQRIHNLEQHIMTTSTYDNKRQFGMVMLRFTSCTTCSITVDPSSLHSCTNPVSGTSSTASWHPTALKRVRQCRTIHGGVFCGELSMHGPGGIPRSCGLSEGKRSGTQGYVLRNPPLKHVALRHALAREVVTEMYDVPGTLNLVNSNTIVFNMLLNFLPLKHGSTSRCTIKPSK